MKNYFYGLFLWVIFLSGVANAQERLRLATTTSTDNSGLLAVLHPPFEQKNNVKVDVIAVGTGKALRLAQNGDVDIVLVHAPEAEKKFVKQGFGVERLPVMHNDFVLLGPEQDPAKVKQTTEITDAFKLIAINHHPFVSRGDESGTHKKEKSIWEAVSLEPKGDWYLSAGQGMGAVLKIANDKLAYTLSDRGTYLAYQDKIELMIVLAGTQQLLNPYHVILVNQKRHPYVNSEMAQKYAGFIRGEQGQKLIREFKIAGKQLFYADVIQ